MKFDKYILKMEFLLTWHFENNFLVRQIDNRLGMGYYDNVQVVKRKTNYIYSVEYINTNLNLCIFLKNRVFLQE